MIITAPPENYFWLNNGWVLKDLSELEGALKAMDDDTFRHHVHDGNNDFSNWIKDVFKDKKLAEYVKKAKNKNEMAKVVERKLKAIAKVAKMPQKRDVLNHLKEAFQNG